MLSQNGSHRLADSTMILDKGCRHLKQFCFGFIAVNHQSGFKKSGSPGNIRQSVGEEASGAGFSQAKGLFLLNQHLGNFFFQSHVVIIEEVWACDKLDF